MLIGKDFQISVNKSPVEFCAPSNGPESWSSVIERRNVPVGSLIIEITEGSLMEQNADVMDQLSRFQAAGIEVALDDFGTGYSSLSYLRRLDIDYIKIDQSFIRSLTRGPDDVALCRAIISMAHALRIRVIAEGVETGLQRDILVAAGGDLRARALFLGSSMNTGEGCADLPAMASAPLEHRMPRAHRQHDALGLRQVIVQRDRAFGQLARLEHLQDVLVHLDVRAVQEFRVVQHAERQAQLREQVGEHHVQALAVGQLHDRHVEFHVGGAGALPVAVVAAAQAGLHRLAQMLAGRMAGVGLGDGLAFDQPAHAIDVDDRRNARNRHRHTAVGLVLEQAFLGQHAEGLAQRVAGYLQAFAQRRFRQALPRLELAMHDALADLFCDPFGQILDVRC
ncbi:protein of unknown function (plasmid) [Cupriavidus taiwanensis]|uniref:EAL domain-containing protein n=1 Tax=Cupriavidus taiwanensis TaxID=164546 RepID=A0A375INJ0_9BURK|nr:protein of unknown function [Cupriavidus taiwanensis]